LHPAAAARAPTRATRAPPVPAASIGVRGPLATSATRGSQRAGSKTFGVETADSPGQSDHADLPMPLYLSLTSDHPLREPRHCRARRPAIHLRRLPDQADRRHAVTHRAGAASISSHSPHGSDASHDPGHREPSTPAIAPQPHDDGLGRSPSTMDTESCCAQTRVSPGTRPAITRFSCRHTARMAQGLPFQGAIPRHGEDGRRTIRPWKSASSRLPNWEVADPRHWVAARLRLRPASTRGVLTLPRVRESLRLAVRPRIFHDCIEWRASSPWSNAGPDVRHL